MFKEIIILIFVIVPLTILLFTLIFRGFRKKGPSAAEQILLAGYNRLREHGYTDLDLNEIEIKLEDGRQLFGCFFLSMMSDDGKFLEYKYYSILHFDLEFWIKEVEKLADEFVKAK